MLQCYIVLQCYAAIQKSVEGEDEVRTMGCFSGRHRSNFMCNMAAAPAVAVLCCHTDLCNLRLQPQYASVPAAGQPGKNNTQSISDKTQLAEHVDNVLQRIVIQPCITP